MKYTEEQLAQLMQSNPDLAADEGAQPVQSLRIVIPDHRPVSLNKYYAGMHWTKRKTLADEAHMLVRAHTPPNVQPFVTPVDITVTAYFKNRPLDASNVFAKVYEDGLIGHVLVDDSPQYVRSVKTVSAMDKHAPRVVIDIEPVIALVKGDK